MLFGITVGPQGAPQAVLRALSASAQGKAEADPDMPAELLAFLKEMEEWAQDNKRDARNDALRYWLLKAPAIASSALSGVLALNHLAKVSAALAAISTVCVFIDATNPGGQLRNAHHRAVHELRNLQAEVMKGWRVGKLSGKPTAALAAMILTSSDKQRDKIRKDLMVAETSFGKHGKA